MKSNATYAFRDGFQPRGVDPGAVAETLDGLRDRNHGALAPDDVVEAARPDDSPLHNAFTWDDTEAAKAHRLWQARQLIRAVVVVYPDADPQPAYVHVRSGPEPNDAPRGYYPVEVVARTPTMFGRAVDELRGQIAGIERTIRRLSDLAPDDAKPRIRRIAKRIDEAGRDAEGLQPHA